MRETAGLSMSSPDRAAQAKSVGAEGFGFLAA
jgi:hypothetical protein